MSKLLLEASLNVIKNLIGPEQPKKKDQIRPGQIDRLNEQGVVGVLVGSGRNSSSLSFLLLELKLHFFDQIG